MPLPESAFKFIAAFALLMACAASAFAQQATQTPVTWFNIQGDASDAASDTIEVDPVPVSVDGNQRIMRVRVSRSTPRKNWDGLAYRSYISEVLFDCAENTAQYQSMAYYMLPNWKGPVHAKVSYIPSDNRPMGFRDVTPNPAARILKAACPVNAVTNN